MFFLSKGLPITFNVAYCPNFLSPGPNCIFCRILVLFNTDDLSKGLLYKSTKMFYIPKFKRYPPSLKLKSNLIYWRSTLIPS